MTAKIRLCLRANKKKASNSIRHDWSHLRNNSEISNKFIVSLKNRFAALQHTEEQSSATTRYKNFETACKEAAIEQFYATRQSKTNIGISVGRGLSNNILAYV